MEESRIVYHVQLIRLVGFKKDGTPNFIDSAPIDEEIFSSYELAKEYAEKKKLSIKCLRDYYGDGKDYRALYVGAKIWSETIKTEELDSYICDDDYIERLRKMDAVHKLYELEYL